MGTVEQISLVTPMKGKYVRSPATIEYDKGRIWFVQSPFALKDEIKAMAGAKWHGYDADPRKCWSVADTPRNRWQIEYLKGSDVYAHFDQPVVQREYSRPLLQHQKDLADAGLTYHYQIFAAEAGLGKTLAAMEVIERSEGTWWWVGPKSSIPNMRREFEQWKYTGRPVEFMSYEELVKRVRSHYDAPDGIVFDECTRLKNPASDRSVAAQEVADKIRATYGFDGYVILMSGTPSPKSPVDWWSLAEICWPGYLREGSTKALEKRLAFLVQEDMGTGVFDRRVGWRDDERKCAECGEFQDKHDEDGILDHEWKESVNEVSYLFERLKGLVIVRFKKDCLDLPPKTYRKIQVKPSSSLLRAAKAIKETAVNAITAMTDLRCLSDGFMYIDATNGTRQCNHCPESSGKVTEYDEEQRPIEVDCPQCGGTGEMQVPVRAVKRVPCPKDQVVRDVLKECVNGRVVIFAAFTASVDRVCDICREEGWDVVCLDGRGYRVTDSEANRVAMHGLDYWHSDKPKVAFVANSISGGQSLTLTKANVAMFYSTDFKPEFRLQAEERIHRISQTEPCTIVDIIHLPTDERALEIVRENRRLELMTLGEVFDGLTLEGLEN